MINVGDYAFDSVSGCNVQVLERIDVWGYVSYRVFNPTTNEVYKANEEQLSIKQSGVSFDENYLRCSQKSKTRPPVVFFPHYPPKSFRCRIRFMC